MVQKAVAPELSYIVAAMFAANKVAGLPHPTIKDVHALLGVSMSTAYSIIKQLEYSGVIEFVRKAGGAHPYTKPLSMHPAAIRMREFREKKRNRFASWTANKKAAGLFQRPAARIQNATREEQLLTLILSQLKQPRQQRSTESEQRDERKAARDKRIATVRARDILKAPSHG